MSLSDGDRRCWSEVVKKISVSADVKDILFKQTGYNVQVNRIGFFLYKSPNFLHESHFFDSLFHVITFKLKISIKLKWSTWIVTLISVHCAPTDLAVKAEDVKLVQNFKSINLDQTISLCFSKTDVELLIFFKVNSVRSAILVLSDENGNPVEEVVIGKGENSVCLKSQKAIRFSTKGCEVFEIEPERIEDPSSLETDFRVTLKPTKYQVSGRIASKSPIPDLKLLANSEIRKVDVETKKISTGYSFSFYAFPGEDLSFHPKSEEHLFDPESLHVYVDNDCHLVRQSFLFISTLVLDELYTSSLKYNVSYFVSIFVSHLFISL